MEWSEIDGDLTTWTLPAARSKNGKAHIIHLPPAASAILRDLRQRPMPKGQTLIFTTTGKTPVSGFSNAVEQVKKAIKNEKPGPRGPIQWHGRWTLHDLRRTAVTTLARLGVVTDVADRMLNHVTGTKRGVAAVYQRYDFMAEREAAARLWANHVLSVSVSTPEETEPSNVIRVAFNKPKSK